MDQELTLTNHDHSPRTQMTKKLFHSFSVVMRNAYGTEKRRIVKSCVSKSAAVNVANILEKMEHPSNPSRGGMVYRIDKDNRLVFD